LIAGTLGGGLQLYKTGLIQGIAVIEKITANTSFIQTFTIRAANVYGNILDRTFNIVVSTIALPQITPKNIYLGELYDGLYWAYQLQAIEPSPSAILKWKLIAGSLPLGTSLSESGLITGYVLPYISPTDATALNWDETGWDHLLWDTETATIQNITYQFTVQVFDGSRYDTSAFTVNVVNKTTLTSDSTSIFASSTILISNADNVHLPIIITPPTALPTQRQNSNFAFKVDGLDLDGATLTFAINSTATVSFDQGLPLAISGFDATGFDQQDQTLPDGIYLDPETGWITGTLGPQVEVTKTYTFQVFCSKTVTDIFTDTTHVYFSIPVTFTITVLGDLNNVIDWATLSNLGTITNGSLSELVIRADARLPGKVINFEFTPGVISPYLGNHLKEVVNYTPVAYSRLPQGLGLLPNGLIVGRTTFEYFTLDRDTTTFDKNVMSFDSVYTFSVTASDFVAATETSLEIPATVSDVREFTITVKNINSAPYENLYLRALPPINKRLEFEGILNTQEYFPDALIYRLSDPYFGKAIDIKFLFAAGLSPSTATTYIRSMQHNHYIKRIELGNVKTAIALDANFNTKYEVVYVEVVDPRTNDGLSAPNTISAPLSTLPAFTTIYPDGLDNMKNEVTQVGYVNQGVMPEWMTNPQADGRVLGFTRAIVLAYTVPGASDLIAYRLRQATINFGDLDFVADRYQLDNNLSLNFDITSHHYVPQVETTFDHLPPVSNIHSYAGTVNFALTIPFDEINGRTLTYILRNGGLDGSQVIQSGQLIIFAEQESYSTVPANQTIINKDIFDQNNFDVLGFSAATGLRQYISPNDGWNNDSGLYGSDLYGSEVYALTAVIPGYLEMINTEVLDSHGNVVTPGVTNQRGGIWMINVSTDEVVSLTFVSEVAINQYVQIGGGQSYARTKLYYDPIIKQGHTVPSYSILTSVTRTITDATRFDMNATRFVNNKDTPGGPNSNPDTNNIFIKFPKTNMVS
jgi:hypothetical protein